MSGLPGYDDWKTRTPEDENPRCEYCGTSENRHSRARDGWQPDECIGECGIRWRDPDAEYDAMKDDR